MVGETEVKERPKSNPDYLMQLMNDRKVMSSLPNFSGIFTHLERLLDEGNSLETLNPPQKSELSFVGSDVNKTGQFGTNFIEKPSDNRRNSSPGTWETTSIQQPYMINTLIAFQVAN